MIRKRKNARRYNQYWRPCATLELDPAMMHAANATSSLDHVAEVTVPPSVPSPDAAAAQVKVSVTRLPRCLAPILAKAFENTRGGARFIEFMMTDRVCLEQEDRDVPAVAPAAGSSIAPQTDWLASLCPSGKVRGCSHACASGESLLVMWGQAKGCQSACGCNRLSPSLPST